MKPNLRQFGTWDTELEAKAREVMELRFAESPESFDFTVCQRPNGTYYGIASGRQCRKGREVNRAAALGALAKRGVPREILGKIAKVKDDKEFGKAIQAVNLGRKKGSGGPAVTPVTKSPTSLQNQGFPKKGVEAAAARKETTRSERRDEKLAKIAGLRAKLEQRRKEQEKAEETKEPKVAKPKKSPVTEAKKENMKAGESEPRTRLEKILQETYGIKGENLTPKELAKRITALEAFDKKYGPEETQKLGTALTSLVSASAGRKATKLSVDEVKALQNPEIQKKLLAGFQDPPSLIGGKNSIIKFKDVDDVTLDAAWAMLSPKMRNAFSNCGNPNGQAWKGTDANGNPINGGNGSPERGKELFRLWLRQDGKCAYTGRPLTWDFSDLEHIKPMGQVGAKAENPNNWVWTLRSVNQLKSENNMDYLFTGGASSSKSGAWSGVNSIKDYNKWQQEFDAAQTKAAGKDIWRDKANAPTFISEYLGNRRGVVDAFNGAGHIKYVAMALGNQPTAGESGDKMLKFPQEQKIDGIRNPVKNLLNPKTEFVVGAVKGKMSPGLWIAENYPDLPPAVQLKVKQIYNDVRLDLKRGELFNGNTAAGFAKTFSEKINEFFLTEMPELV
jgi:hypothetical protein